MEHHKVYVANLPNKVSENDLEEVFAKYGKIRFIDLKRELNTPPFAVVEYQNADEADSAASGSDGCECSALFGHIAVRPAANQRIRVNRSPA
jgi:arginine/serine-rich splicing factor 1/9